MATMIRVRVNEGIFATAAAGALLQAAPGGKSELNQLKNDMRGLLIRSWHATIPV